MPRPRSPARVLGMASELPDVPFLLSGPELRLSPGRLRGLLARGDVRRVIAGVGVRGDVPDCVAVRARSAQLVLRRDQVVVDHSAAWLHGVDVGPRQDAGSGRPLEVADLAKVHATRRRGTHGCKRTVAETDVVDLQGVRVTSPARTAADLACRRGRLDAMAVLDAFARHHGVGEAEHRLLLPRFAGRRGVTQYRELVPLIDPRAESPRESWTRLAIHDAGLPPLESQVSTFVRGFGWARLDLGDRELRICVEYDGADFHGAPEQQAHDESRRDPLVRDGWAVVVVRAGDFGEPGLSRWLGELRTAYAERTPPLQRRYARGEGAGRHRRTG